jgi:hypothetical protein
MRREHLLVVAVLVLSVVSPAAGQPGWTAPLRGVDDALARMDLDAARRAWQEAYLAALGSWHWEGMLEVGHAQLRLGRAAGQWEAAVARARNLFLAALFRARQQRSAEGARQTASAFARLGDRDVAERCLRLAEALAAEAREPSGPQARR